MKITARAAALAAFIGLPLVFHALGNAPRRSIPNEVIAILTLLAFSMMLGQYFLAQYLEGGVKPWDAFVTTLTTFDNIGILLSLFA